MATCQQGELVAFQDAAFFIVVIERIDAVGEGFAVGVAFYAGEVVNAAMVIKRGLRGIVAEREHHLFIIIAEMKLGRGHGFVRITAGAAGRQSDERYQEQGCSEHAGGSFPVAGVIVCILYHCAKLFTKRWAAVMRLWLRVF